MALVNENSESEIIMSDEYIKKVSFWKKCEMDILENGNKTSVSSLAREMLNDPEYISWKIKQSEGQNIIRYDFHTNFSTYYECKIFYTLVKELFFYRFCDLFRGKEEYYLMESIDIEFFKVLFNMVFNKKVFIEDKENAKDGLLDFVFLTMPNKSRYHSEVFREGKKILVFLFNLKLFRNEDPILNSYLVNNNFKIKMPSSHIFKTDMESVKMFEKELTKESMYYRDFLKDLYLVLS